jgi:hypothetical protein
MNNCMEKESITIFKNLINKNSKLRMNFVFILQFFRLNNQFELTAEQMKPMHILIE